MTSESSLRAATKAPLRNSPDLKVLSSKLTSLSSNEYPLVSSTFTDLKVD